MRILLITSASFSTGSTGISQTLENLLDYSSSDELVLCTPAAATGLFSRYPSYAYDLPSLARRLPAFMRKIWADFHFARLGKRLADQRPDLVLIANLDGAHIHFTRRLLERSGIPFVVYLLDNISDQPRNDEQWLMENAAGHIFISKYMAEANLAKYPQVQRYTVAHNPVDEEAIAESTNLHFMPGRLHVAYAGAIWPMHADALFLFAEAIKDLREQGIDTQLTVYTAPHFHDWHQSKFMQLGIKYAGFLPFGEIKAALKKQDALLVTSSFKEEFRNISSYSVQTKVTDYLACGIPVLSAGPEYAACNRFLAENELGWTFTQESAGDLTSALRSFLAVPEAQKERIAELGLNFVREHYRKKNVQSRWKTFLRQAVHKNS